MSRSPRPADRHVRAFRRKRRRWLKFWSKQWKPLPAFFTWRTGERLEGDSYRRKFSCGDFEVGIIESVRYIESNK